ncbi:MAG: metal-dependent transcriptional regulator [Desulfurococcales archaeon]|nr:metal-dependent transcriptional regulator [Desulfurococcales archaeon]
MIGRRSYDYLKAVYRLGGTPGAGCWVPVGQVAEALGVSVPTASIMLRRLAARGLLEVREGVGVRLTEEGFEALIEYLWKYGILEVAFVRAGLDPERAREAAASAADRLPREVADALCSVLGEPRVCPHGKPIPRPGEEKPTGEPRLYCGVEPLKLTRLVARAARRSSQAEA